VEIVGEVKSDPSEATAVHADVNFAGLKIPAAIWDVSGIEERWGVWFLGGKVCGVGQLCAEGWWNLHILQIRNGM
jgi:hypothetical protein